MGLADQHRQRDALRAGLLRQLADSYDESDLDPDPLVVVREFADPRDQEIAGFFAAALAYGNARTIVRNTRDLFNRMDVLPHAFVSAFDPSVHAERLVGWRHRLHTGADMAALSWALSRALGRYGSLQELFVKGMDESDANIRRALARFVGRLRAVDLAPLKHGKFYRHLLPSPVDGSACKRLNLFLRWMVRRKLPDLGVWTLVEPSKLIFPLDTHVARICRNLGITQRHTPNWQMAEEITQEFRKLDPGDPVRYDYAVSRLGILGDCPSVPEAAVCVSCRLHAICAP